MGDTVIASAILDRLREKRQAGLFSSLHLLGVGAENDNDNYYD